MLLAATVFLWGGCGSGSVKSLGDVLPGQRICFRPKPGEFEQFFQFDESGKVLFGMIDQNGKALRPPGKAPSYEVKDLTVTIKEGKAPRLVLTFSQSGLDQGTTFTVKDTDGSVEKRTITQVIPASPVGLIKP